VTDESHQLAVSEAVINLFVIDLGLSKIEIWINIELVSRVVVPLAID